MVFAFRDIALDVLDNLFAQKIKNRDTGRK